MAGFIKDREKTELYAGLITMGIAVILLVVALIVLTRCSADAPEESTGPSTTASTTASAPTEPVLIPNPYSAGDFAYRNGYLTCISGPSELGVDVSSHQGSIEWDRVADAGISFAMVRIGYRGYGNGKLLEDPLWSSNLQRAQENGLQVGVYFFSQAISVNEAVEEARLVLQWLDGQPLDLPIAFDWEYVSDTARTANVDAETLIACALAFCETVKSAGYDAMVYFNIEIANRLLDLEQVQQSGYGFWLAAYTSSMTYPHRLDMWQYTDGGSVPGISGNVDLNLRFTYE